MQEPWTDNTEIWEAYCQVKEREPDHEAFLLLRSLKEEFEWFKLGYIKGEERCQVQKM